MGIARLVWAPFSPGPTGLDKATDLLTPLFTCHFDVVSCTLYFPSLFSSFSFVWLVSSIEIPPGRSVSFSRHLSGILCFSIGGRWMHIYRSLSLTHTHTLTLTLTLSLQGWRSRTRAAETRGQSTRWLTALKRDGFTACEMHALTAWPPQKGIC